MLRIISTLVALLAAFSSAAEFKNIYPKRSYGKTAELFGESLTTFHVMHPAFDDNISRQAWTNLVTLYDYDHSVFLKSDLDRLSEHETTLDDELSSGNVSFGYRVYNLYCKRLQERIDFATNLLATAKWDFSSNETYRIQRKDVAWPETRDEAEEYWRKRMKNELLAARIGAELGKSTNAVNHVDSLIKKYRQYVMVMTEPDEEAVLQYYLSSVAHAYDPHSDFLSPMTKEDFDMEMTLSLCGVGAVLSMDEGALKIVEIMNGGPIDRDGRIHEGDKIVGVKQADGPMEDIMWQPMKKTIRKIRGMKDTRVTLEIIPRSDPGGTTRKRIELVRDEIKLEDQAATGRVEKVELNGVAHKLGYVFLPTFYGTMDKNESDPDFRSCARDIARYIAEFNAAGVDGMILDLRGNGGGALCESVRTSQLFVYGDNGTYNPVRNPMRRDSVEEMPGSPVVQTLASMPGSVLESIVIPPGSTVAFRKPLVVLTDRASASASEIVAGHLQDVGRAVIVGDGHTHGKGTVQVVMPILVRGKFGNYRNAPALGSFKVTTSRFYRINGRSTQIEGVVADIRLPSLLDSLEVGEDKLPNALPFSETSKAEYSMSWNLGKYIPELQKRSAVRLADDAKYRKHIENVEGMKKISERKEVPLDYESRKAMMTADRELRELDDLEEEDDGEATKEEKRRRRNEKPENDVVLDEAFRILADLVDLVGDEELPKPKGW